MIDTCTPINQTKSFEIAQTNIYEVVRYFINYDTTRIAILNFEAFVYSTWFSGTKYSTING